MDRRKGRIGGRRDEGEEVRKRREDKGREGECTSSSYTESESKVRTLASSLVQLRISPSRVTAKSTRADRESEREEPWSPVSVCPLPPNGPERARDRAPPVPPTGPRVSLAIGERVESGGRHEKELNRMG